MSFVGANAVRNQRARDRQRADAAAKRRESASTTPRSSMGDLHIREVRKEDAAA